MSDQTAQISMMAPIQLVCPVCDATATSLLMEHPEVDLYRCTQCQHCFADQSSIESPENYSEEYYEVTHKNWFEHPNISLFKKIAERIFKYSKPTASVLDIGCGKGDLLKYLHAENPQWALTGIDLSEVPQIPGIAMLRRDFLKEPFEKAFDVVTSLAAIEHVEDIQLFARKIGELCAKDGVAIVMTNNESGLFYGIARALYFVGIKGPFIRLYSKHHLNHFSVSSLRALFERHGFEIVETLHHSFPIRAVDIPTSNPLVDGILRVAVACLFFLGKTLDRDFLQTIVCRKKVS